MSSSPVPAGTKPSRHRASSSVAGADGSATSNDALPSVLSDAVAIKSNDRRASQDFAFSTHLSHLSELKAAASPNDFRLSDFNLERIHRFVDEPHATVGKNMHDVAERVDRREGLPKGSVARLVRDLVSPYGDGGDVSFALGHNLFDDPAKRKQQLHRNQRILEHDNKLGVRSRFGDGDGTFWDRWLGAAGIETKSSFIDLPLPHASSLKDGSVLPRSGFKRYDSANLIDTGNAQRVRPYSLYGARSANPKEAARAGAQRGILEHAKERSGSPVTVASGASSGSGKSRKSRKSTNGRSSSPTQSSSYSRQQIKIDGSAEKDRRARKTANAKNLDPEEIFRHLDSDSDSDDTSIQGSLARSESESDDEDEMINKILQKSANQKSNVRPGLARGRSGRQLRATLASLKKEDVRVVDDGDDDGSDKDEDNASKSSAFQDPRFAQPAPLRARHAIVAKKEDVDEVLVQNYFGKGGGDWGNAKNNFYDIHSQLLRQKTHFTPEQYQKLLELRDDDQKKEAELVRLAGRVRMDDDIAKPGQYETDEFDIDYLRSIAGQYSQPTSRTKYLYGCINARDGLGMPPRMGPILRKFRTVKIFLPHQGMGDELGAVFARALAEMPLVQRINIMDNRLSDVGVACIVDAIHDKTDLLSLIIGHNKVDGDAAEKLAEYIAKEDCPLLELGLSHADIDDGECVRFIDALATNKNLTNLDMSHNLIGSDENLNVVNPDLITGGEAIASMLACSTCKLKTLNLQWNLLRFNSAVEIGESLSVNNSLTELDLGYNAFGAMGGMAIGQSLVENASLRKISVTNNGITPQAAFCIAVALRQNLSLRSIDLSGNPLGLIGGKTLMSLPMELGDRLELFMDGCNFKVTDDNCWFDPEGPSGLFTQAAKDARKEILDRVDDFSDKSTKLLLMVEPALVDDTKIVKSIKEVHTVRHRLYELLPQLHPSLDLSQAYDRAVLIELLRFVAEKDGCALLLPDSDVKTVDENFVKMNFISPTGQTTVIDLERMIVQSPKGHGDEELIKWINGTHDPRQVFNEFDKDGSGEIDRQELAMVFKKIGKDASQRELDRVMAQFDIDGSGSIEMEEFVEFLNQLQAELNEAKQKKQFMVEPGKKRPWRAPSEGRVEFKVIYNPILSEKGEGVATNNETLDRVLQQVKKTNGESIQMLQMSLSLMRLGVDEAQRVFDELLKGLGDRVEALKLLLPVICDPQQARVFVDLNLKERNPYRNGAKCEVTPKGGGPKQPAVIMHVSPLDENVITVSYQEGGHDVVGKEQITLLGAAVQSAETEKRRLQGVMGYSYYPIMGIPCGHYKLDMSKPLDRLCLSKLSAISNTESSKRRKSKLGDTSQKGNWMNFRNEVFRGQQFDMSPSFLDPAPKTGVLEFDFVSTTRPVPTIQALSEKRFSQLLEQCFSCTGMKEEDCALLLRKIEKDINWKFDNGLWTPKIRTPSDRFGLELATLLGEITPEVLEKVEAEAESKPKSRGGENPLSSLDEGDGDDDEGGNSKKPQTPSKPVPAPEEKKPPAPTLTDALKARLMAGGGLMAAAKAAAAAVDPAAGLPKFVPGNRFSLTLKDKPVAEAQSVFAKMKRMSQIVQIAAMVQKKVLKKVHPLKLLQNIQDVVSTKWISALHARFLLELYTKHIGVTIEDQKLKLNLVCTLHQRIVDLHNFDIVLGFCSEIEQAHLVFRLGWLNVWSPLKPDMYYELVQSRREERLVAKALLHLAVEEPGENWWDETFQWSRFERPIPGWALPITWFSEEGMPWKGVLKLTYYSGEGLGKEDCKPIWKLRHALCGLVLAPPPPYIALDEDSVYKSTLPPTRDLLTWAQSMLAKTGIKLNYRQKGSML